MQRETRVVAAELLGHAVRGDSSGAGPRLVVVAGPDAGRTLPVVDGDTLGRDRAAEIRLRDPAASRVHARIERRGDRLAIVDAGSKNGTELNGRRLRSPAALRDGARVRLGATVLEAAGLRRPELAARPSAEAGSPQLALDPPAAGAPRQRHRAAAALLLLGGTALALVALR